MHLIFDAQAVKSKCRLLYVVGQLGPGGLERQLCYLLQTIDRERYMPAVAVWNFNENEVYVCRLRALGVPMWSFPHKTSPLRKLRELRRLVKMINPEVIHSYSFHTNFAAWWAAAGTKTIAVGGIRSDFTNDKKSCGIILGSLSARWPSNQIYNNFAAAEKAKNSRTLFAPRNVFVVPNGLDLQQFPKVPLPSNGQVRILGVGSLLQYKRWDRLLTAALKLKQRGLQFLVEIAGGGTLRESLERQARDLDITDQVKFVGHADDVAGVMGKSTFIAHTSDVEGCPNVLMEAMACGRAVVATDAGDASSLIEDGKSGFVVRRGDDQALTDRMATLIMDQDLCRRMGEAGRVKAEREFGLDRLVEETLAAYRTEAFTEF
jgi:glycosyltransferase involved in cell wall biosynthesis